VCCTSIGHQTGAAQDLVRDDNQANTIFESEQPAGGCGAAEAGRNGSAVGGVHIDSSSSLHYLYRMSIERSTRQAPVQNSAALHEFLRGLIDYAGLFPPAGLPMEDAATNYAAYKRQHHEWMLSSFICPAARLGELHQYADLFTSAHPLALSVLASGGQDGTPLEERLLAELDVTASFFHSYSGSVRAQALEVRIPESVVERGSGSVAGLVESIVAMLDDSPIMFERLYLEVGLGGDWRRDVFEALNGITGTRVEHLVAGLKMRCGGLSADAFPTAEQVAHIITCCHEARLPFKATAGLHHPIRHFDRRIEVMQHGFFNVFGAGVLLHALDLTEAALRQVIRSENLRSFTFDNDGFAFQDLRITTSQLKNARENFAHSFGSCSVDEPLQDLHSAGLL